MVQVEVIQHCSYLEIQSAGVGLVHTVAFVVVDMVDLALTGSNPDCRVHGQPFPVVPSGSVEAAGRRDSPYRNFWRQVSVHHSSALVGTGCH